jgi:hypothetical protein
VIASIRQRPRGLLVPWDDEGSFTGSVCAFAALLPGRA